MWIKNRKPVLALGGVVIVWMGLAWLARTESSAQVARQPFASSIEQRQETIDQLRKLNRLMEKQLELLTSGKLKVIVIERPKQDDRQ